MSTLLQKDSLTLWRGNALTLAVFFVSYFVYLLTLYPTVTTEDSGEFATAVATLGIAHPPGYPLYVFLGKIFTFLLPFGNLGWRVNVFSAFWAAGVVSLLFLLLKFFTKRDIFSFFASFVFAFSPFFWSQAIRAEVYSLNLFLFLAVILLTLFWYQEGSEKRKNSLLLWVCFLYGLSLGNHHLMFLAGFPLAAFVFWTQPSLLRNGRFLAKAFVIFLLGLSVYLYLPIRASMQPSFNWGNPSSWENFWDHVTRKLYTSDAVDSSLHFVEQKPLNVDVDGGIFYFVKNFFSVHVFQFSSNVFQYFLTNFFWPLLIFLPVGFWWIFKKFRQIFWLFLGFMLFYGFLLSKLLNLGTTPKLPVDAFKDRPFYIPILLLLCTVSLMGLHWFTEKFLMHMKKWSGIFLMSLFIGLSFSGIFSHFREQNQSGNYLAYDLAKMALQSLPKGAVVYLSNNDNTLFPVMYLNKVEGFRQDLTFYIPSPIFVYRYFESYEKMVAENPGKRFFVDFPFVAYVGKTYDYSGTMSEIVDEVNFKTRQQALLAFDESKIRGFDHPYPDHYNAYLRGRFFLDKGLIYEGVDEKKQSEYFQKALDAAPESENIFTLLIGNYFIRSGKFSQAIPYLQKAYQYFPDEYSLNFQLFVAQLFRDDKRAATTFYRNLLAINKKQFLSDYDQIKTQFQQFASQFEAFEISLKNQ